MHIVVEILNALEWYCYTYNAFAFEWDNFSARCKFQTGN